ncbi:MAG: hypothetical protein HY721_12995 [Planctomycetes bacterium]|nr:hypothetical protein [Planctomycetota bacterium]
MREGMAWQIRLEIPEELANRGCAVLQLSRELREHPRVTDSYPLEDPLGPITVQVAPDQDEPPWEIRAEEPRVFKLVGASGERGRRIARATSGTFLAVVPAGARPEPESAEWLRGGHEQVKGASAKAYVVDLAGGLPADVVFVTSDGRRLRVPRSAGCVELHGSTVEDPLTESLGPLFIGEPPRMETKSGCRTATFVVVDEGGRDPRGRAWRADGSEFEALRTEIATRGCGWFSVRCYDEQNDLIESVPFRFSRSLERVLVENPSVDAVPGPRGHEGALLRFVHGHGCRITSARPAGKLHIVASARGTETLIPPNPEYDETEWHLREGSSHVTLAVRVERVWWALVDELTPVERFPWSDQPLDLLRTDFKATSSKVLYVRLPGEGWRADVGFEAQGTLPLQGSKGSHDRSLPLRNLGDRREIGDTLEVVPLRLYVVSPDTTRPAEMPVARIAASSEPRLRPVRLDTASINPARVATALTRLARSFRGSQRRTLHRFLRERYVPPRGRRGASQGDFVPAALCLIEAVCEAGGRAAETLPRRWRERASAARDAFPALADEVRRFFARARDDPRP